MVHCVLCSECSTECQWCTVCSAGALRRGFCPSLTRRKHVRAGGPLYWNFSSRPQTQPGHILSVSQFHFKVGASATVFSRTGPRLYPVSSSFYILLHQIVIGAEEFNWSSSGVHFGHACVHYCSVLDRGWTKKKYCH